ncbi:MAG: hypothetical protein WEC84_04435 [Candidatus Andersenbacteria bacterium]
MKPNIQQQVVSRHRSTGISARRRSWTSRSNAFSFVSQRGSVDHATVTITFGVLALVIIGLLGFFYLQQVVDTASQGTDVRQLETQIVELRDQQKQLELEGAQLRSLQAVEGRVDQLNLVEADKVSYLAPVGQDTAVALAEGL